MTANTLMRGDTVERLLPGLRVYRYRTIGRLLDRASPPLVFHLSDNSRQESGPFDTPFSLPRGLIINYKCTESSGYRPRELEVSAFLFFFLFRLVESPDNIASDRNYNAVDIIFPPLIKLFSLPRELIH